LERILPSPPITDAFVTLPPRQSSSRQRAAEPNHALARGVSQSKGVVGCNVSAAAREGRRGWVLFASTGAETSSTTTATNRSVLAMTVLLSRARKPYASTRGRASLRVSGRVVRKDPLTLCARLA
jgi:hypothetical protein